MYTQIKHDAQNPVVVPWCAGNAVSERVMLTLLMTRYALKNVLMVNSLKLKFLLHW